MGPWTCMCVCVCVDKFYTKHYPQIISLCRTEKKKNPNMTGCKRYCHSHSCKLGTCSQQPGHVFKKEVLMLSFPNAFFGSLSTTRQVPSGFIIYISTANVSKIGKARGTIY